MGEFEDKLFELRERVVGDAITEEEQNDYTEMIIYINNQLSNNNRG